MRDAPLGAFGSLRPGLPPINFLELRVLAGIAARNADRELCELGRIVGALAVGCHALCHSEKTCAPSVWRWAHVGLRP